MKQKQGVRVGENKPPSDLGAKSLCIGHSERGGEDILRAVYRTYRVRPSVHTEFALAFIPSSHERSYRVRMSVLTESILAFILSPWRGLCNVLDSRLIWTALLRGESSCLRRPWWGSGCRGKGHMGMNYGGLRVGLEMG